jgi:hypothetical protein
MASARGGRSRPQNSFYASADGAPIWASTTVSNGPALWSSAAGDAGSGLLLGGPAGKTSATLPPMGQAGAHSDLTDSSGVIVLASLAPREKPTMYIAGPTRTGHGGIRKGWSSATRTDRHPAM